MRIRWIEQAKGLGIILVVFGHAWRGVDASGLAIPQPVFDAVDAAIYAFHMPLFFFLSGLVFLQSRPFGTLGGFAAGRLVRLLWPLALWTWIFFGIKMLAGDAQNETASLTSFPLIPFPPLAHFWFLWALFLLHIVMGVVIWAVPRNWLPHRVRLGAAAATLVALGTAGAWGYLGPWLQPALIHLPYFLAGLALSGFADRVAPPPLAGAAAALAVLLIVLAATTVYGAGHALAILLCLSVALSGASDWRPLIWGQWLQRIGSASLAIYVMHTIFSAAVREVLLMTGVTDVAVHLVVGTAVGLGLPYLAYRGVRGQPVQVMLGL
ncbi:acyltransferase [Sulfitobacter sp. W027]|uniref:acyltransferase family protein n=1 Tax=Sulfitobacter sp. W027 TaxID=2867025 RepID=UPI0021A6B35A|nr:acyltransferase [Sulfitobacter sp. W027]UWR34016.1 acyltransferase [Sulfitobacter sp. W027]